MSINTEDRIAGPFSGNDVTTEFPFEFKVFAEAEVVVEQTDTDGVKSTLVLNTDYTLVLNPDQDNAPGGTVTTTDPLVQDYLLTITSEVAYTQGASNPGRVDVIENSLDKLTILVQQLKNTVDRAINIPISDGASVTTELPTKTLRASQFLAFDAEGDVITSAGVSSVPVSTFMETFVDDTSASAALTTLGVSAFAQTILDDTSASAARSTLGGAASGANADITSMTALASVNSGQLGGFRNGVINGAFDVWQRGTSFTPSSSTITYTADRWAAYRSGTTGWTLARQTGPDGSPYCIRVQRDNSNSSTAVLQLAQSFETLNSHRYRGKKATVRFKARKGTNYSAASDALQVVVATGTGTDENLITGYTGQVNDINSTVTLTTSWQTFSVTSAATLSASLTEIGVQFNHTPVGTAGAADYYEISEVELVEGGVASTYFERLDYSAELDRCERYYQNINPNGVSFAQLGSGYTSSSSTGAGVCRVTKSMRAAPTISYSAVGHWRGTDGATASACTVLTFDQITNSSFRWTVTGTGTPWTGNGRALVIEGNNTSSAQISLVSEL